MRVHTHPVVGWCWCPMFPNWQAMTFIPYKPAPLQCAQRFRVGTESESEFSTEEILPPPREETMVATKDRFSNMPAPVGDECSSALTSPKLHRKINRQTVTMSG